MGGPIGRFFGKKMIFASHVSGVRQTFLGPREQFLHLDRPPGSRFPGAEGPEVGLAPPGAEAGGV